MRLIVVVRSDLQAKANNAAKAEDAAGGERTFTVPLALAATPITTAAYWCSWDFTATAKSITRLRTFLQNQGFAPGALGGDGAAVNADRSIAIFDADRWTPDQVLTRLGLVRIETSS